MRIFGLDYLRGLAALFIAIYHVLVWSKVPLSYSGLISKFGLYGVSIFFILSGYAMHYVYKNLKLDFKSIKIFFQKRIIRIFPLFWFVTTITLIFTNKDFSLFQIFINYAGIFSFIQPASYIAGGSWSIGIELVFYAIFPILIFSFNKKLYIFLTYFLLFFFFTYFAFFIIDIDKKMSLNWPNYVNPLNQLLFFYSGMLLSHFKLFFKKYNVLLVIFMLILFSLYEVKIYKSEIIGGSQRMIYYLYCIIIVSLFVKINFKNRGYIHKSLLFLGDVSYSLYLIHPIVYSVIDKVFDKFIIINNVAIIISIKLISALIVSYVTYNIVEMKGKNLFSKVFNFEK